MSEAASRDGRVGLAWALNVTALPLIVAFTWLVLAAYIKHAEIMIATLLIGETALGAYLLALFAGTVTLRMVAFRTIVGVVAIPVAAIVIWIIVFDGYVPGQ